jgi:hypothetical protein
VTKGKADGAMSERAIGFAAVIFKPSRMDGVLVKVLRRNAVVLAVNHATQAAEKALSLIGALSAAFFLQCLQAIDVGDLRV